MKKIGFLFSFILIAAITGLLTLSCNQVITEEFGTVILNFAGDARSIGADGLPVLNKAKIRVQGSGDLSGSFSKDFSSGEGVSLSLPVGDEVELKVSVLTPSARWSSKPLSFTVKEGVNSVSVKLSKKAAALHNFLFSQRLGAKSTSPASFNLKLEDGTVILSDVKTYAGTHPSFVRGSKGGIYVLYAGYVSGSSPKAWKMFFYDSEGKNPQAITLPSDSGVRSFVPVSDFTAGKTYAAAIPDAYATGDGKLYRLEDDRFIHLDSKTELCAVDNNRLACIEKNTAGSSEPQVSLKIFTDISQAFQDPSVPLSASYTGNINADIKIQGISLPNIRDIYVRGDYVYLLFSAFEAGQGGNGGFYSIGGLIRYKITQAGSGLTIGSAEKFGFDSSPQVATVSLASGSSAKMLQNYDYTRCFYHPSMFIGFDEDHLYIADDGFDAKLYEGSSPSVGMKNKNRIAAFNIKTASLSFENAPAGTNWLLTVNEEDPSRYVQVDYENLENYITTTASSTEINYIEITGTIPIGAFNTTMSGGAELGKKIKKDISKKIALKLPENITGINDMQHCFLNCVNLVSLSKLPADVKKMSYCFSGCENLSKTPEIPSNVTDMRFCFKGCKSLSEAPEIPATVTDMSYCFSGCTSLSEAPDIPSTVKKMIYCFSGCKSLSEAPEIPADITKMDSCFSGCTSLTQAPVIPSKVKDMSSCFKDCTSLSEAPDIPASVTDMSSCFSGCINLTKAPVISSGVKNMNHCFSGCTSLTQAPVIPASVEKMNNCFYGCTYLTKAPKIPARVEEMSNCFKGCKSLIKAPEIIKSNSKLKSMSYCFKDCTVLKEAPDIPSGVTNMNSCFEDCTALQTVKLECSYKDNSFRNVFKNCTALQDGGIKVKNEHYSTYTTSEALTKMAVPGNDENEKRAKFSGF